MWQDLCLHSVGYYVVVVVVVVRATLVLGSSTNWLDNCDDALRSFNGTTIIYILGTGRRSSYSLRISLYLSGHFLVALFLFLYHEEPLFRITLTSCQALAHVDGHHQSVVVVTRDVILPVDPNRTISPFSVMLHLFSSSPQSSPCSLYLTSSSSTYISTRSDRNCLVAAV